MGNAGLPGMNGHSRAGSANLDFTGASNASTPAMMNDMSMGGGFNQPFVPQDLWQMPMTLEWDWAGMTQDFTAGGFEDLNTNTGLETTGVLSNLPTSGPWNQGGIGDSATLR